MKCELGAPASLGAPALNNAVGIENSAASPAGKGESEETSLLQDAPAAPPQLGDGPVTAIKYYYINGLRVAEQRDGVWTWTHSDHLR